METLLAYIAGTVTTVAFWLFTTIRMRPKIAISKEIGKTGGEVPVYKLKIVNKRQSDIYNISVFFKLTIPGHSSISISIVDADSFPFLERLATKKSKNKGGAGNPKDADKKWIDGERVFPINLKNSKALQSGRFDNADILKKHDDEKLTLEDIFKLDKNVYATLVVFGFDKFSGVQHCFRQYYTGDDIKRGDFKVVGSTELTPEELTRPE
jgi:hypothetical protein